MVTRKKRIAGRTSYSYQDFLLNTPSDDVIDWEDAVNPFNLTVSAGTYELDWYYVNSDSFGDNGFMRIDDITFTPSECTDSSSGGHDGGWWEHTLNHVFGHPHPHHD